MDSLVLAFQVVFPLFFSMILGYWLRHVGMMDEHTLSKMNKMVFKVLLPVLIFMNIMKADIATILDWKLLSYLLTSLIVLFLLLCWFIPKIEKENSRRGTLIQGIFRSNFVIFGVPITAAIFGEESMGITSIFTVIVVPMYNVLSVFALEMFRGGTVDWKKVLKEILTNPLIIATVLGTALRLSGIASMGVLSKALNNIAQMATPIALMILGGSLNFKSVKSGYYQIILGVFGRLVFVPAILLTPAILFGYRNEALVALMTVYAAPHSVSSFVMAEQMGGDGELAAHMIVFSTAVSIFTIFLWVLALKGFGWITYG
jgi:predicted permease